MAKYVNTDVLEEIADEIIAATTHMVITGAAILTDGIPDYTKVAGAALCSNISMASSDFTKTVNSTNVTLDVGDEEDVTLTANGTMAYVLLLDTVNSKVIAAQTTESVTAVSGQDVYIPAFRLTIGPVS